MDEYQAVLPAPSSLTGRASTTVGDDDSGPHNAEHPRPAMGGGAGCTGVRHFRTADCEGPRERSRPDSAHGAFPSPLCTECQNPTVVHAQAKRPN